MREAKRTQHPARDYALVQVLLQTGMRIGECAALPLADLQLGAGSGTARIRAGKGNKARTVPLNSSARAALVSYLSEAWGVAPTVQDIITAWPTRTAISSADPVVWRSQKGGALSVAAIRTMIDQLVRLCASRELVPVDASAHTLRHTFALNYLKQQPGDLSGLATLLGHSSLDTTRIYGQPSAEQLAERVERLEVNAYGMD